MIAQDIIKYLTKLKNCFDNAYAFESSEEAESTLRYMISVFSTMFDEMHEISVRHGITEIFKKVMGEIEYKIRTLDNNDFTHGE